MLTLTPVISITVTLTSALYGSLVFDSGSDETIYLTLAPYGQGPEGPEGPEGPQGPPADTYEHTQASPATEWIVNHNFGRNPIVDVLSPGGIRVLTEIQHMTINQARVYFLSPQTGKAIAR